MTDTPNAQQERREAVQALDRPTQVAGLDSKGIQEAVRQTREIKDTTQVMVQVWTRRAHADDEQELQEHFDRIFSGRLLDEDVRIVPNPHRGFDLELRTWTIHSEWKDPADAEEAWRSITNMAGDTPEPSPYKAVEIVGRNSKRAHELKDYGVKLLGRRKPVDEADG